MKSDRSPIYSVNQLDLSELEPNCTQLQLQAAPVGLRPTKGLHRSGSLVAGSAPLYERHFCSRPGRVERESILCLSPSTHFCHQAEFKGHQCSSGLGLGSVWRGTTPSGALGLPWATAGSTGMIAFGDALPE